MGRTCGTYGEKRNTFSAFVGKLEEERTLKNININGRIILNWTSNKQDEKSWIRLIWLRIWKWRAVVNVVMKFRVP
jgi:hypothetical protein